MSEVDLQGLIARVEALEGRVFRDEKRLAIIATKGTLDMAYPPLILASTAAALGYEVTIFFTFYGLQILKKNLNLEVSPTANPAMPMNMGGMDFGWMPDMVRSLPGMTKFATGMMKGLTKQHGVASIEELRDLCIEADVRMIACQMTVDLFGFKTSDLIDGLEYAGAATYFEVGGEADINLFI
ncbi:MAG: peroxiredoxin family protein [Alphaproteobacteria bacterium CG_4_10_14_0_2_um_filter_63_37]|nr:MAG: peroxiredoxin family protein [Alphaproteobacteria bacterium CG_4_10_14_0_2_um_filter_63_37]